MIYTTTVCSVYACILLPLLCSFFHPVLHRELLVGDRSCLLIPWPDSTAVLNFVRRPEILLSGPGLLNPIFRHRGPSKQVGHVCKYIWGVFCIEFACGNVWNHCTVDRIQTFWDFQHAWLFFRQPFGETNFSKQASNKNKSIEILQFHWFQWILCPHGS